MLSDSYSPRERVLATLDHSEPDRVPLDTWMSIGAIQVLCRHLNMPLNSDPNGMWHEGILQRLRVDLRRPIPTYVGPELKTYADGSWDTPLGVRRKGIGYGMALTHPLRTVAEVEQILAYPFPVPDWFDYSGLPGYCQRYAQYAFIGGSKFPLFHEACDLMGMDQAMINFFDEPELMHTLLDKLLAVHMALTESWIAAAPVSIDVMLITDDFGGNQNMLISPKQWREFFKPRLRQIIDFGHAHDMRVMLHSDGSIRQIIPDLIEIGLDVLNPIEPETTDMNPVDIKKNFGAQLVMHGGASSRNLVNATEDQIKLEAAHLVTELAPGGGFILCPSNHLMPDMPVENILALYDTAFERG